MTQHPGMKLAVVALALTACAHGRFVDVDPIYEPVQQVHQTFYRDPAFNAKDKRIAIMDFKAGAGEGQVFADAFAAELFSAGFKVAERQNVQVLLEEMKMATSGAEQLTDTQILQRIGKMADVDIVIVGGVVAYKEDVAQLEFDKTVQLPFAILESQVHEETKPDELPSAGFVVYRWKPGSYHTPAGLPVHANIYASARAIDVSTGKIVWIDTVNVQTSGIVQVTGLERLGKVMAGNLGGTYNDSLQLFIYNGERFHYPPNWEEVKQAWGVFERQGK